MCLVITSRKPRRVKFTDGKRIVYKRFRITDDNRLISPYQDVIYRSGTTTAKGEPEIIGNTIYGGAIHVYNSLRSAKLMSLNNLGQRSMWNSVIVPVTVYEKDFIAEGTDGEVCFTKIFISAKDYKKALQG